MVEGGEGRGGGKARRVEGEDGALAVGGLDWGPGWESGEWSRVEGEWKKGRGRWRWQWAVILDKAITWAFFHAFCLSARVSFSWHHS